jgi:hypothetical protein
VHAFGHWGPSNAKPDIYGFVVCSNGGILGTDSRSSEDGPKKIRLNETEDLKLPFDLGPRPDHFLIDRVGFSADTSRLILDRSGRKGNPLPVISAAAIPTR